MNTIVKKQKALYFSFKHYIYVEKSINKFVKKIKFRVTISSWLQYIVLVYLTLSMTVIVQ
jgi:hypothetical protein